MKSKRLSLLLMLGGWLVISSVFAATSEYLVIGAQPYDLQERLNVAAKDGWKLKSVIMYTDCSNNKKECLVVVLERE